MALVLGAGCSLEAPTNLQLASAYSEDAHRKLVLDGVLDGTECGDPTDLSALASAVVAKTGSQAPLVRCFPLGAFRLARPNKGYLIAAALLREQALDTVLTLNFDLGMTNALTALSALDVTVIPGPAATDQVGARTVIYLHRSVEELDLERWILTVEDLRDSWHDGWEDVVARRTMSCPVVVFAGLGSPAAVLTETVGRIRGELLPGQHHVFVVDPSATTKFESALNLDAAAHIQTGWSSFMELLGARVAAELLHLLRAAGHDLCKDNGWDPHDDEFDHLCTRLASVGLVGLGQLRARWLLSQEAYSPDDDHRRRLLADLLLGVALLEREASQTAHFTEDGLVEFLNADGDVTAVVALASGSGTLRWSALEARLPTATERRSVRAQPNLVLVSGVVGPAAPSAGPPADLIVGEADNDIVNGWFTPPVVDIDGIRADYSAISEYFQ
ncbi:hypothetical protein [Phycicoccus sp. Soil803]|uniref:hypothetical protein n=1 Tax=Phycicoccus sp. Soil803 TaxID=1736415 RepID=UPI0012F83062|nr:hypothetical protein [Phycicoccus sp. Soil803]